MSGSVSPRPTRPRVIAHRGASGTLPENTLPAYALAVEQRADMIEIDLHRTRDGAVVIAHDEGLERLGGRGEIADATLSEVRDLDAGNGEHVPTLDEVIGRFGSQIPFNLELKRGTRGDYPGLPAAALQAVEARDLLGETLFSSFYDSVLNEVRSESRAARIALLISPRDPARAFERARALGAEALNPWVGLAQPELIEEAHAEGLAVYVFTVDSEEDMRRLLDLGVDGLFTNHPDRLRAIVGHPEANFTQLSKNSNETRF